MACARAISFRQIKRDLRRLSGSARCEPRSPGTCVPRGKRERWFVHFWAGEIAMTEITTYRRPPREPRGWQGQVRVNSSLAGNIGTVSSEFATTCVDQLLNMAVNPQPRRRLNRKPVAVKPRLELTLMEAQSFTQWSLRKHGGLSTARNPKPGGAGYLRRTERWEQWRGVSQALRHGLDTPPRCKRLVPVAVGNAESSVPFDLLSRLFLFRPSATDAKFADRTGVLFDKSTELATDSSEHSGGSSVKDLCPPFTE
jgi:hypothetical protein